MRKPTKSPHLSAGLQPLRERAGEAYSAIAALTADRGGQPTKKTTDIVDALVMRVAMGRSLLDVCQDDDMPAYSTVTKWRMTDPEFTAKVDVAYEWGECTNVDGIVSIASGGQLSTGDVQRDRLLIDAIKWKASKINSKRFGDRLDVKVDTTGYTIAPSPMIAAMMAQPPMLDADYVQVDPIGDGPDDPA